MTLFEAHKILDQVKLGARYPYDTVNEALYHTGDLYSAPDRRSAYIRSKTFEEAGIGEGFNWSVDWKTKINVASGI